MAMINELFDTSRSDRNTIFMILNFTRNTNEHLVTPSTFACDRPDWGRKVEEILPLTQKASAISLSLRSEHHATSSKIA
jgi:hypothetical protein